MNNPEIPKSPSEPEGWSTGDYLVDYCLTIAGSRRQATMIRRLYDEHHAAFAAYLSLDDVSPIAESLGDDFESVYVGTYLDEGALIDEQLEALGWREAVDIVIRQEGIPEGALTWDHDAIYEYMRRNVYDIVDLDGDLHVFSR